MKNTMVTTSDVQRFQKFLEEYLGNRKAAKVAVEVSEAMQGETKYTHNGEIFLVHKDEAGKIVFTLESTVKKNVQAILNSYLKADEVQECTEQLIVTKFKTIKIPGSKSLMYKNLMKHEVRNENEEKFMADLKEAVDKSHESFRAFVNAPLIDESEKIHFISDSIPTIGYSYNELEVIAKKNGIRLGTKNEYILFLGWLITSLVKEGWSERDAWYAVCVNPNFYPSKFKRYNIPGKWNFPIYYRILANDEAAGFWFAGGNYSILDGWCHPLAYLHLCYNVDFHNNCGVGWFVC